MTHPNQEGAGGLVEKAGVLAVTRLLFIVAFG